METGGNDTTFDAENSFKQQQEIVALVLMEMTIGVVGIFINLMVVSSVRSEDSLQESTRNLLLANICFSNLVISFLVKPISAIYVSYALSTGEWKVGLAFCSLYTLSYRTTWLVYPFTILALCWSSVTEMFTCCSRSQHNIASTKEGSIVKLDLDEHSFQDDTELHSAKKSMAFPTVRQKCILSFIWIFASLYGLAACFPEKMFSGGNAGQSQHQYSYTYDKIPEQRSITELGMQSLKSDLTFCPVRSKPGDLLDKITIYLSIYIPTILGPILTFVLCVISLPFSSSCLSSSTCCSFLLLPCLTFLHISNYYINLFFADTQDNDFYFILVKYGLGFSFIIFSPLIIIAAVEDIRLGVKKTFKSSVLCVVSVSQDETNTRQ